MIENFLFSFAFCSTYMVIVFLLARRLNFFSLVDVAWSYGFVLLAGFYFWLLPGATERKLLLLVCVALWSLRLGTYLALRLRAHFPMEDGRYTQLAKDYQPRVQWRFFWFFQYQGWSIAFLSTPFLFVMSNSTLPLQPIEYLGAALFLVALSGEALADFQLSRFKANPANRGRVCKSGLWRYSRHPNYFFESCIWLSYFVFALGSENGWITVYVPLVMLYLILRVTGVPPAEQQSIKSKGEEFRRYQQETSVFFPWFPKKS